MMINVFPFLTVVDSVASAVMDAHLANSLADRLHVPRIAVGKTVDTRSDLCLGDFIAKGVEPVVEFLRGLDIHYVIYK